jgi:DNA polymerase elongation subunit (family B)
MGKTEYVVNITGVSVLDYIDLYKKYILTKQESYSLGHISQEELGETKVDHSEYGSFNTFWQKNFNKFVHYNIVDTQLVRRLDNKLRLIELVLTVAYEANVNYEDVSSPVKVWDAIITNYCLDRGIVMPQQNREPAGHLDGAYVKEPTPGWYKNVVSLDATSLYPSIIMTNNISPETYVGNCGLTIDDFLANKTVDVDEKYIVTPAGAIYSKEKRGVLPELVERFMKLRRDTKNEMLRLEQVYEDTKDEALVGRIAALDSKQQAIKVLMNSLYGATANEYFRFFKTEHAASITLTGQYVLRTIENNIDTALGHLFKTGDSKFLVYIDTDSLYFSLDEVFKKFNVTSDKSIKTIEKLAKEKITPIVNKFCDECCSNMRSFENKLSFKLEMAADKAIWMGKKKYVLRAHSSEGVTFSKPKFKVKGLEMVRSSTPRFVRDKLKNALDVVFDTNERGTQEYIANVKEEFFKLPHQQIAFPRGANNLAEYSHPNQIYTDQKSVPMQVRASLLYNHHLKKHGIDGKYASIGEGDKIKFIYLKKPNKVHENTMGFPADGAIPEEFGILDMIDYDTQFEKTFLAAMQIILTPIGWNAEEVSSLEEFF